MAYLLKLNFPFNFLHISQVQNYYVAAGMNSSGITAAGGIGKYLAEWITDGSPSRDLWPFDVKRFVDLHNNKKFLQERVKETLGKHRDDSVYYN